MRRHDLTTQRKRNEYSIRSTGTMIYDYVFSWGPHVSLPQRDSVSSKTTQILSQKRKGGFTLLLHLRKRSCRSRCSFCVGTLSKLERVRREDHERMQQRQQNLFMLCCISDNASNLPVFSCIRGSRGRVRGQVAQDILTLDILPAATASLEGSLLHERRLQKTE